MPLGTRKIKYFIWGIFVLLLSIFIGAQKVRAAGANYQEVVINEVMWMGSEGDAYDEWLELKNTTDRDIPLDGWRITKNTGAEANLKVDFSGKIISKNSYFIISYRTQEKSKLAINPDVLCQTAYFLSNDNLKITLYDNSQIIDTAGNGGKPFFPSSFSTKASMERNDPPGDGTLKENWHTAVDSVGFIPDATEKGTPGSENSEVINLSPTIPTLKSPENNSNLFKSQEIEFSWLPSIDPEGQEITYDFYLSCSNKFEDNKFIDSAIQETNYFLETNNIIEDYGSCSKYYWKIIAFDGSLRTESSVYSFTISEPVYSDDILINELYPDPQSGEEWIELYNNSIENVNLKYWFLEDLRGGIHHYIVNRDLVIPAYGFVIILRSDSGITLNNNSDGVRLIRPDGRILYETPIFSDGDKGWSFARNSAGSWQWTTKITPGAANVIVAPILEEAGGDEEEELDIPVNSEPIDIKTGDYKNYENWLVKISGEIVETSGNTFWLDDGSGRAKIYIQAKTGIDKPEMHTGDIFEVVGIVNLYRETWRILPQKQEDIRLIKTKADDEVTVKVVSTKKSSSTTAKKTSSTSSATARSPTSSSKQIASTDNIGSIKIEGAKSPFWVQFFKALTGLSVIFLIILIVRVLKTRKERVVIGGDFGDET